MTKTTRVVRWLTVIGYIILIWHTESISTEDERFAMAYGFLAGWIMSSLIRDP